MLDGSTLMWEVPESTRWAYFPLFFLLYFENTWEALKLSAVVNLLQISSCT
uniref:Uncharacterized protein n=1 Tax=Rhizophora mucronata TaxID=61149 RepID=A0A2P2NPR0_RHIMU